MRRRRDWTGAYIALGIVLVMAAILFVIPPLVWCMDQFGRHVLAPWGHYWGLR